MNGNQTHSSQSTPLVAPNKAGGVSITDYNFYSSIPVDTVLPFDQEQQEQDCNSTSLVDDSESAMTGSTTSASLELALDHHKTTVWQTFLHLTKGYIGVGVLSLPWAISQLGIPLGVIGCFVMSYWTSYNCWTVVRLKRYIEATQVISLHEPANVANNADAESSSVGGTSTATSVTYGDVGGWAYGKTFHSYVTACVCVQQLAVCTVFFSFLGENLLAVLHFMGVSSASINHISVISMTLPAVLALSFLPSLKTLAPVVGVATVFILVGFGLIGVILGQEWGNRPDELPQVNLPSVPLALCAILYSYEGICLILPIESAMKEPKHFGPVFATSMTIVACLFASFGAICVFVFGHVTNGSITAFLLQTYGDDDPTVTWYLQVANLAVSLSVLLTFPLQLFPALELIGPWMEAKLRKAQGGSADNDERDLTGFEPLPPVFEHQVTTEFEPMEHDYDKAVLEEEEDDNDENDSQQQQRASLCSKVGACFEGACCPKFHMPGDSVQLRTSLVLLTYVVAVVVPNVQSLISLAGALAGSSTALLIPPILELAYLRVLEQSINTGGGGGGGVSMHSAAGGDGGQAEIQLPDGIVDSTTTMRTTNGVGTAGTTSSHGYVPAAAAAAAADGIPREKWTFERCKCYVLLFMGSVFCVIGTIASIRDIVRVYRGDE